MLLELVVVVVSPLAWKSGPDVDWDFKSGVLWAEDVVALSNEGLLDVVIACLHNIVQLQDKVGQWLCFPIGTVFEDGIHALTVIVSPVDERRCALCRHGGREVCTKKRSNSVFEVLVKRR